MSQRRDDGGASEAVVEGQEEVHSRSTRHPPDEEGGAPTREPGGWMAPDSAGLTCELSSDCENRAFSQWLQQKSPN